MSSTLNFDLGAFQRGLNSAQERVLSIEERRHKRSGRQALFDEAIYELNAELEELQVANEELRIQNEALGQAADNLALERLRYKQLFDLTPDPLLTTDSYGNIKEANRAACAMLNLKPEHLHHKPLVAFVPVSDKKAFRQGLLKLQQDQYYSFDTLRIMPRSASEPIQVTVSTATLNFSKTGSLDIRWVLKPLNTEAPVATDTANRSAKHHPTNGETATATSTPGTSTDVTPFQAFAEAQSQLWDLRHETSSLLDFTVKHLSELIGTHCFLSMLSADKARLVPMSACSRHQKADTMLSQFLQANPSHVSKNAAGKVLKSLQPLTIGSESHQKAGHALPGQKSAARMLMIPLRADKESLGLITLMREKKQPDFTSSEIALAQNFADHVALTLQINNLTSMAKKLADSKLAYGTFLANLCAELLTPMHALDGFAAMLREQVNEIDSDEMKSDARSLCEAATLLNTTLADLLELSRLETGSVTPAFERLSMPEFLNDISIDLQNYPQLESIKLKIEELNHAGEITTDNSMVRQAINRLVSSLHNSKKATTIHCTCSGNHLQFNLQCEGGAVHEATNGLACSINGSSNAKVVVDSRSDALPAFRGVALVLVGRICTLLNGKLEFRTDESGITHATLSFPLH